MPKNSSFIIQSWKPNGEKCPVTNIDEYGNGVVVWYLTGVGGIHFDYKDGVFDDSPFVEFLDSPPNP